MKLPPPHRKTEPPTNLITIAIAPPLPTRRTNRHASNRPTSLTPTTPLTATHSPPGTTSTRTQSPHPLPHDPPLDDTDGITTAPPWPQGRVVGPGYVPVLSDHDRGFMRPRPTRIEGGTGRDEFALPRRRIRGSEQRTTEFITVRADRRRGILRGSVPGDSHLFLHFAASHMAHRLQPTPVQTRGPYNAPQPSLVQRTSGPPNPPVIISRFDNHASAENGGSSSPSQQGGWR